MATVRAQDRLQPALLDRLTDDDVESRVETSDSRVINRNRLRDAEMHLAAYRRALDAAGSDYAR